MKPRARGRPGNSRQSVSRLARSNRPRVGSPHDRRSRPCTTIVARLNGKVSRCVPMVARVIATRVFSVSGCGSAIRGACGSPVRFLGRWSALCAQYMECQDQHGPHLPRHVDSRRESEDSNRHRNMGTPRPKREAGAERRLVSRKICGRVDRHVASSSFGPPRFVLRYVERRRRTRAGRAPCEPF